MRLKCSQKAVKLNWIQEKASYCYGKDWEKYSGADSGIYSVG